MFAGARLSAARNDLTVGPAPNAAARAAACFPPSAMPHFPALPRSRLTLFALALLGVSGAIAPAGAAENRIELTRGDAPASVIVYAAADALGARTARRLADYLREQTDVTIPVVGSAEYTAGQEERRTVIVLDGSADHRLATRFGSPVTLTAEREDAYLLRTVVRPNAAALVLAVGRGPAGAKYAAYRLMRELELRGRQAVVRPLEISAEPQIKTRSVSLFNVWNMPIEVTRRHNTEAWPQAALERYVDMYDCYGFNAIESHDRFNDNYLEPLFGLKRADWRAKVLAMAERAHANGQQFFLRIWGHVVMDTPKITGPLGPNGSVPKRLADLCVNDPAGRKRWEEEILKYYVSNYAGHIDHLIGHWCDPGVCRKNGCDYTTPLKLQMELHRAFKAVDPHFTSSFNTWFFDVTKDNPASWAHRGWAGYNTDFDLINAGILDRDVVIATATSNPGSYKADVVKAIIAAGHQPAIWTWYRADHEIRPSLHVHLHERLGEYFRSLPEGGRQLAWHNVERNVHGAANTATYYVAGRLMWDPNLNVDDLLREFLTLTFGAANAGKVMPAYLAIEAIRCPACYKNWESTRVTGAGTADARADLTRAEAALAQLGTFKIDPAYRPRLPLDISPAQIITDLTASLQVIRDFARCRAEELPAAEHAFAAGDRAGAQRQLDQLEATYGNWAASLAGRQESSVLQSLLKEKRAAMGVR
jgi:hypothetical protein